MLNVYLPSIIPSHPLKQRRMFTISSVNIRRDCCIFGNETNIWELAWEIMYTVMGRIFGLGEFSCQLNYLIDRHCGASIVNNRRQVIAPQHITQHSLLGASMGIQSFICITTCAQTAWSKTYFALCNKNDFLPSLRINKLHSKPNCYFENSSPCKVNFLQYCKLISRLYGNTQKILIL